MKKAKHHSIRSEVAYQCFVIVIQKEKPTGDKLQSILSCYLKEKTKKQKLRKKNLKNKLVMRSIKAEKKTSLFIFQESEPTRKLINNFID